MDSNMKSDVLSVVKILGVLIVGCFLINQLPHSGPDNGGLLFIVPAFAIAGVVMFAVAYELGRSSKPTAKRLKLEASVRDFLDGMVGYVIIPIAGFIIFIGIVIVLVTLCGGTFRF
jgi:hypothetical protein